MASPKLTEKESLAIVEDMRQKRIQSVKDFFIGTAKNLTTDLPGFLMDVADKLAGDTSTLGEKDRSAQLFEKMTGIKTKSGSGGIDELVGGMVNPISSTAVIVPAFLQKTIGQVKAAESLLSGGANAKAVYQASGIFQSPTDDILRSVIPDTAARLKFDTNTIESWQGFNLVEVLDHPELYKAIPELKGVRVRGSKFQKNGGAYYPEDSLITLGEQSEPAKALNVLLHEVQHSIQEKYGMTGGGNRSMFFNNPTELDKAKDAAINLAHRARKLGDTELEDDAFAAFDVLDAVDQKAFKNYLALGGEAEARAVEAMLTNPNAFPRDLYGLDVPITDLIADPASITKLDSDPTVKSVIQFLKKRTPLTK